jgi:hypothetical protein
MRNLYQEFQRLIPQPALQVGTVESVSGNLANIRLPGGETLIARGADSNLLNQKVFVKNNVIEGLAPNLPTEIIEI